MAARISRLALADGAGAYDMEFQISTTSGGCRTTGVAVKKGFKHNLAEFDEQLDHHGAGRCDDQVSGTAFSELLNESFKVMSTDDRD